MFARVRKSRTQAQCWMRLCVCFGAFTLFVFGSPSCTAQDQGRLTLLEGNVRVIRGTALLRAVEGMSLRQGDMFESSATGFAQLEFSAGNLIAIGPSTRIFLPAHSGGTHIVVLNGWLKAQATAQPGIYDCVLPQLDVRIRSGTVVLHTNNELTEAFAESGSANLNQQGRTLVLEAGEFASRPVEKNISIASGIPPSFIGNMPPPFKDTLPSRISGLAGRKVEPSQEHEVSYSDLQPWFKLPLRWRRNFVARFRPRLRDVEFRKEIELHLRELPEWDPVLHPEKYQDKKDPVVPESAGSQRGGYPQ